MAMLSRSQFSQAAHVSKAAVTKAVTAGRLIVSPDGKIDTYNPLNAEYLKDHASDTPPPRPTRSDPPRDTVPPQTTQPLDDTTRGLDAVNLKSEKDKADIALKRAQTRRHDMALAEKKGELIPRELVHRKYAALDAALKTHLRDLPRRTAAQLTALALSGGRPAVEQALEAEISASLGRVVKEAKGQGLAE